MNEIDSDLSKLTTIPLYSIQKLLSKFQDSICYEIQEQYKDNNKYIEVDIHIGTLILYNEKDTVSFKFIPSRSFENEIREIYKGNDCNLIKKLENSITEKITEAYKDLF